MPFNKSIITWLAMLPESTRLAVINALTPTQVDDLGQWYCQARPEQLPPPGEWVVWLIMSGRGFGKTRAGAQWVINEAKERAIRIALVGETAADVRDVMIEGESGIMASSHQDFMPIYEPSKRLVTWPNGSQAHAYSGDKPDLLRGPQHHKAWADEPAKWRYLADTWDQLEFGMRLGNDPRVCATTTPRPIPKILDLLKDPSTVVTRGTTYDNAHNLAPAFIKRIKARYEGTRLGRQEIHAAVLTDVPGALWTLALIESLRVAVKPDMEKIAVGVDPNISSDDDADECGIVGVGRGTDQQGYVLDDKSIGGTPHEWATAAVNMYHDLAADVIVAEKNQGGEMVEHTIRTVDRHIPIKLVHATRGKITRAEPISSLYEQRKFHHVGMFATLEDQMCSYIPGETSPDHMDALVWASYELFPSQAPNKARELTVKGF
jgi:phage terminase large subunit-like protein